MKKILLMLLMLITSFALVACDNDDDVESYTCYDYLDTEYSFTYADGVIVSINGVEGGSVVDYENQLIIDYYDGNIVDYIDMVDTICVDEYND